MGIRLSSAHGWDCGPLAAWALFAQHCDITEVRKQCTRCMKESLVADSSIDNRRGQWEPAGRDRRDGRAGCTG